MDYNKFVFNIIICVFLYLIYDKCNLYFCGFWFFFLLIYIELKMFMMNDL